MNGFKRYWSVSLLRWQFLMPFSLQSLLPIPCRGIKVGWLNSCIAFDALFTERCYVISDPRVSGPSSFSCMQVPLGQPGFSLSWVPPIPPALPPPPLYTPSHVYCLNRTEYTGFPVCMSTLCTFAKGSVPQNR